MENITFMPEEYMDDGTLRNHAGRLSEISRDFHLSQLSYEEKAECLFHAEQIALTFRQSMLQNYDAAQAASDVGFQRTPLPQGSPLGTENHVTLYIEDNLLEFHLPNTVIRTSSDSWYLSKMVTARIKEYEALNQKSLYGHITSPAYLIIKRKVCLNNLNAYSSVRRYRDNENLETSKLINSICAALGFTDNAFNLSYTSLCETVSSPLECGTVITIFGSVKFTEYFSRFKF